MVKYGMDKFLLKGPNLSDHTTKPTGFFKLKIDRTLKQDLIFPNI